MLRYGPQLSAIPHLLSRYVLVFFCAHHLPSIPSFYPIIGITLSINNSFPLASTRQLLQRSPRARPRTLLRAEAPCPAKCRPAFFSLAFASPRLAAPYH